MWQTPQATSLTSTGAIALIAPFVANLLGGFGSDFEWQLRAVSLTLVTTGLHAYALVLAGRPARIHAELKIDLPRPRPLTHPDVVGAVERILGELGLKT